MRIFPFSDDNEIINWLPPEGFEFVSRSRLEFDFDEAMAKVHLLEKTDPFRAIELCYTFANNVNKEIVYDAYQMSAAFMRGSVFEVGSTIGISLDYREQLKTFIDEAYRIASGNGINLGAVCKYDVKNHAQIKFSHN